MIVRFLMAQHLHVLCAVVMTESPTPFAINVNYYFIQIGNLIIATVSVEQPWRI